MKKVARVLYSTLALLIALLSLSTRIGAENAVENFNFRPSLKTLIFKRGFSQRRLKGNPGAGPSLFQPGPNLAADNYNKIMEQNQKSRREGDEKRNQEQEAKRRVEQNRKEQEFKNQKHREQQDKAFAAAKRSAWKQEMYATNGFRRRLTEEKDNDKTESVMVPKSRLRANDYYHKVMEQNEKSSLKYDEKR